MSAYSSTWRYGWTRGLLFLLLVTALLSVERLFLSVKKWLLLGFYLGETVDSWTNACEPACKYNQSDKCIVSTLKLDLFNTALFFKPSTLYLTNPDLKVSEIINFVDEQ